MRKSYHILYLLLACSLIACSPREVRTAQAVVRTADSLWQEGKMYDDSLSLAQAYETLSSFNNPLLSTLNAHFSTNYAHSCYHYGRMLRQKDDPVAAMQVFINATHSRTRDYHILGRIYSNMGDLCHLANEFQLAYDMYERSADSYLHNGDTLLYYFDLNNMAFELAEEGKKEETLALLDSITNCCNKRSVLIKTWETKALLYQSLKCHDSVITIVDSLQSFGYDDVIGFMMKARAFYNLNNCDSALYYANNVVQRSPTGACAIAAYYILSHSNDTINKDSVLLLTSARADAQKAWAYSQSGLSQAVQLLEQDFNKKPDLRWLYAIIVTLVIITCIIGIYVYRKYKKQELLTQKIDVLEKTANTIQEKKDELSEHYLTSHKNIENEIENRCSMLRTNDSIKKALAWKNYNKMCNIVDKRFYFLASKLRNKYSLNETEVRLCILTLLECEYDRMAELLYRSSTSIGTLKIRVARKLGTSAKELRRYLIDNVCIT